MWRTQGSAAVLVALVGIASLVSCTGSDGDRSVASAGRSARTSAAAGDGYRELRLNQPRAVHRATRLQDGRVLLTGGCTLPGCGGFEEARVSELFDPGTGSFVTGPRMQHARASGTATLLADGRVLLTGGYPGEGREPQDSAEVYDPAGGRFENVSAMTTARADQSATLMADGRVLIEGGTNRAGETVQTTEWFDPATNAFEPGRALDVPRAAHVAVVAGSHVVLIGGTRGPQALASTSVLTAGQWRPGPQLPTPLVKFAAVALDDHRIFVVGGSSSAEGQDRFRTTAIVDLERNLVRPGPLLSEGEYKLDGAVVTLGDGRVVIAAGDRINVYTPDDNSISVLRKPAMGVRSFATATAVAGDRVLAVGGYNDRISPTRRAWLVRIP